MLLKIELSEITPFFYNNFFCFGGGGFPPFPPLATPLQLADEKEKQIDLWAPGIAVDANCTCIFIADYHNRAIKAIDLQHNSRNVCTSRNYFVECIVLKGAGGEGLVEVAVIEKEI